MDRLADEIIIEGIISAGKTDISRKINDKLSENHKVFLIKEPIINCLLSDLYKSFQVCESKDFVPFFQGFISGYRYSLNDLIRNKDTELLNDSIIIHDRSLKGDYVFVKLAYKNGDLSLYTFKSYINMMTELDVRNPIKNNITIFVYCHPKIAYVRCKNIRSRPEEQNVEYNYLLDLNKIYFQTFYPLKLVVFNNNKNRNKIELNKDIDEFINNINKEKIDHQVNIYLDSKKKLKIEKNKNIGLLTITNEVLKSNLTVDEIDLLWSIRANYSDIVIIK